MCQNIFSVCDGVTCAFSMLVTDAHSLWSSAIIDFSSLHKCYRGTDVELCLFSFVPHYHHLHEASMCFYFFFYFY